MMIDRIKELENTARALEPSPGERLAYAQKVFNYADQFIERLPDLKAYQTSADKARNILNTPFSDEPEDLDNLIELLKKEVDAPGLNPASAGHLGYIPGGGLYPSALGDLLAAVANRYAGVFFSSPGAVRIENMCIRWMCDLVGYDEKSAGNLTSGGSIANLIAFVTARDSSGIHSRDFERAVIYTTEQVHHCADKSFKIAGMSDSIIRHIPMDEYYRMIPVELNRQIEQDKEEGLIPFLVFASAGTTDIGAVDPLRHLGVISRKHNLWFHVDAAYGGFFLLTEYGKEKLKGIEMADSVIIDPHKGLFLPYGSGAVLVKDGRKLYDSQHMTASYMQDTWDATEEPSPADLSPELSKHFRGLRMWLPLQLFGIKPFRAALEEKLWLTRYFHREIQNINSIEVGPEPELSVVYFRYNPQYVNEPDAIDRLNEKLIQKLHNDGRVFLSSTRIEGAFYIRLVVLNFRTHLETIDLTLDIIREKIDMLEREFTEI